MPAPSGKIKLSGALGAPARAPHLAGTRKQTSASNKTGLKPTWRSRWFARLRGNAASSKPATSSKPIEQKSAKSGASPTANAPGSSESRPRPANRASFLPGGLWLWCLLGLAIGLGVWLGGRAYLRTQLVEQLSGAQSEAVALQSIDALLRLDANATIDVSRGLGHPEFMVANAAYRALTGQLDAWRSLSAAEQLRRMQQVVEALKQIPTDIDQDHRILLAGLASRIYAEALSNREAGAANLLADCKRVMALSDPLSTPAPTMASVSNAPAARVASSTSAMGQMTATGSLRSGQATDDQFNDPVPPPLPSAVPPNRQIIQKSISDDEPVEELETPSASVPSLDSSSASRSSGMPRLMSLTPEQPIPTSSRASMQLTSSTSNPNDAARRKTQAALAQAAREDQAAEATISGMEELPIEQLVRLLASVQPRVSQAAALMLSQRGMSDSHLELAIKLATGSTQQRQDLLQAIAARDDLDPRPWLLWMAADGEVMIRQQAVGLLGPLLDNDVRRRLRLLLNKESDEQVNSTLRRVLSKS